MMYLLVIAALFSVAAGQSNGTCRCGFFTTIQNSGFLPPAQNTVGPVYILPEVYAEDVVCNGNGEAACDLFCDTSFGDLVENGYGLDTVVEVEVSVGVYENHTLGAVMCERSLVLHPDPTSYDGTVEGGEPVQMAVHIDAGTCADWVIRREYPEFMLCCSDVAEYFPCTASRSNV